MSVRQFAAAFVAIVALAACGTTGSTESGVGGNAAPAVPLASAAAAPGAPVQPAGQGGLTVAPQSGSAATGSSGSGAPGPAAPISVGTPPSADIERSVSAAYTVPSGAFLTSFAGVIGRAVGMGGYVVSSNTQPDGSGRIVSGSVTLKVPAAKIADFLNAMPATFTASSINFASIDHTAEFVDVNARLASAHVHLDALDALLAKATSIADITTLEQQIETVQTEVDTDQGQLNVLTASVDLATAAVQLSERGATVVVAPVPGPVTNGVSGGWNNAVQVTGAVLDGAITALPLLALAVAAWLVWRRVTRHTPLRRRPTPTD